MRRATSLILGFAATAMVLVGLLTAGTASADAAGKTMYFRDGLGASAKVTYNIVGQRVNWKGRLWDKGGDGYHARIYGYTNGEKFGIRKATRGRSRAFRGASPVKTYFKVCTYNRRVPLRCTTKWTTK
jgi:hypothetical protein